MPSLYVRCIAAILAAELVGLCIYLSNLWLSS